MSLFSPGETLVERLSRIGRSDVRPGQTGPVFFVANTQPEMVGVPYTVTRVKGDPNLTLSGYSVIAAAPIPIGEWQTIVLKQEWPDREASIQFVVTLTCRPQPPRNYMLG